MFFSELLYKTDACGKIGPWMLQFAVGGVYGQEKPLEPSNLGTVGNINNQNNANTVSNTGISGVSYMSPVGYNTNNVDMWMLTFKSYIPIIPEKAPGQLRNSLGLSVNAFTGQDMRRFAGSPNFVLATYSYDRNNYLAGTMGIPTQTVVPNANYVAPVDTGGWAQLMYYFTDTVWTGFYYGQNVTNLSKARSGVFGTNGVPSAGGQYGITNGNAISPGAVAKQTEYHVNLVYDPNPAIRLGLEYSYYITHYAANLYNTYFVTNGTTTLPGGGLTNQGNVSTVRFSAQYFF